jgi:predicted dehydrogenase
MDMSDKIRMGFIGVSGRGYGALMHGFSKQPDVEMTAVCDVYQPYLDRAVAFTDGKAKAYYDYKDLLADEHVDAVAIATPPHWHALIALDALAAGKDVYCEKPMCRYPMEGRLMVDYAAKYKRITQVGTQIHATENYHKCVDVVRSGVLGRITAVRNFCAMNDDSEGLGTPPDAEPPIGLDWETWIGPAPERPFNVGRFRDGMHRYYRDYVDSWLHELGPHIVELPFWALELSCPRAIAAAGGRYATHSSADVPDTVEVTWEFDDLLMTWSMMQANSFNFGVGGPGGGRRLGIVFHGTEGTLLANYGLCQLLDKKGNVVEGLEIPQIVPRSPGHEREFLDGILTRQECSCSFANHLPMHTALNLAHIALDTGRKLHWDETNWKVIGDEEANALITPQYRAPYKLPIG